MKSSPSTIPAVLASALLVAASSRGAEPAGEAGARRAAAGRSRSRTCRARRSKMPTGGSTCRAAPRCRIATMRMSSSTRSGRAENAGSRRCAEDAAAGGGVLRGARRRARGVRERERDRAREVPGGRAQGQGKAADAPGDGGRQRGDRALLRGDAQRPQGPAVPRGGRACVPHRAGEPVARRAVPAAVPGDRPQQPAFRRSSTPRLPTAARRSR